MSGLREQECPYTCSVLRPHTAFTQNGSGKTRPGLRGLIHTRMARFHRRHPIVYLPRRAPLSCICGMVHQTGPSTLHVFGRRSRFKDHCDKVRILVCQYDTYSLQNKRSMQQSTQQHASDNHTVMILVVSCPLSPFETRRHATIMIRVVRSSYQSFVMSASMSNLLVHLHVHQTLYMLIRRFSCLRTAPLMYTP